MCYLIFVRIRVVEVSIASSHLEKLYELFPLASPVVLNGQGDPEVEGPLLGPQDVDDLIDVFGQLVVIDLDHLGVAPQQGDLQRHLGRRLLKRISVEKSFFYNF